MKNAKECRCCKSKELLLYLDLGNQPLANSYLKGSKKLKEYPLKVNLCSNCFHSQLSVVVNPDDMFLDYLYVSGTTQTFRNHCKNLAKDAVRRFPKKSLDVLDIACNDGTQLEYFRELGCSVQGVDPAVNLRSITKKKKISVAVEYWTPRVAKKLNKKYSIITGTNVFAHVDDLDEFLKASKIALADDGLLILEFPYAVQMVKHNEFDTVYHEHLSYFLVHSFKALMDRVGFKIVDVLQTPIHGGSIRFFIKKGSGKHVKKVEAFVKKEKNNGLLRTSTYIAFSKRVAKNKNDLKELVISLKKKNKKVIGYGASAKGNTMLNFFKIKPEYIVDDNSLKWDYKTPGMSILIKDPEILTKEKEDLYIIILSWNFYNEIVKKIISLHGESYGDRALLYVPKVISRKINTKNTLGVSA